MSPVRFATIGTGWIVDAFLDAAAKVEELIPTAVYSRDPVRAREFAGRRGIPLVFSDLEAMASCGEIDAVYIASPNALHVEQSLLFLRHGKHVLCEKPATIYPGEAELVLKEARQRGLVFMEAIVPLHLPRMQLLADTVKNLGRLSLARINYQQYSSKYPAYLAGQLPNIFNPAMCTGTLEDLGIYCVYPALALFGRPLAVHAFSSFLDSGADAAGCAVLEYSNFQAVLTYSKIAQSALGCEFVGENAAVTVDSPVLLQEMRLTEKNGNRLLFDGEDRSTAMSYEARDFASCILHPDTYADKYAYWSDLMCSVADVMLEIRRKASIRFPGDQW